LKGAQTKVKKTYTPVRASKVFKIQEADASSSAAVLITALADAKIL
jgi:hypothetical protein